LAIGGDGGVGGNVHDLHLLHSSLWAIVPKTFKRFVLPYRTATELQ
jgi:hypothetical protein